jgi:hypothetical protein
VIAVGKHAAAAAKAGIEPAGDAHPKSLKSSRKRALASGLDHEVDVAWLQGIVDQAKAAVSTPCRQRSP